MLPTTISIIIVAFNEERHIARLKQTLDGLLPVEHLSVETILVDGGSRDGTAAQARAARFDRIIELPGANIPVCRNRGVAESGGRWLAFVDADCFPEPVWLQQAAALLAQGERMILGWPVLPPPQRTWVQESWHLHWSHKSHAQLESIRGIQAVRQEAFRLITTRNMLMHRASFDRVGGFDESLPTGEDTDFVFRGYLRGLEVLAVPSLRVVHEGEPATLGEFFRQQCWHANRSSYRKIAQHSGMRTGGRAPLFTALFTVAAFLFLASPLAFCALPRPFPWIAVAALPLLVALPALRMALKAGRPFQCVPLSVLYAAYGLARSLDLLGFFRDKRNWKSA